MKNKSRMKQRLVASALVIVSVLVVGVLFFYLYRDFDEIVNFYFGAIDFDGNIWNILTTVFTGIASVCAYFAYDHSIRMREHSAFDALFTQLLGGLQSYINNRVLQVTKFNSELLQTLFTPHLQTRKTKDDVFLNFIRVYRSYSSNKAPSNLNEAEICSLWNAYTDALVYRSSFLNCFKYLYHIVDAVDKSPLEEKDKAKYIGVIQGQLNLDVLFCYLINQIVAYRGFDSEYFKLLKKYNFFKNLWEDGDCYGKLVKETIPSELIKHIC